MDAKAARKEGLDFRHIEYSKIGLPLVESIQRIMIRAEIFGQTLSANRSMEHPAQRHPIDDAAVDAKPNHATRTLVHHDENPMCSQCGGFAANKSQLHKLSFVWPRNVSQDGPPDSGR